MHRRFRCKVPAPLVGQNSGRLRSPQTGTGSMKRSLKSPVPADLSVSPILAGPSTPKPAGYATTATPSQVSTLNTATRPPPDVAFDSTTDTDQKQPLPQFSIGRVVNVKTRSGDVYEGTVLSVNGNQTLTVNLRNGGASWVEVHNNSAQFLHTHTFDWMCLTECLTNRVSYCCGFERMSR